MRAAAHPECRRFARGLHKGGVERERDDHYSVGQCDRGCEEKRPAPSCE